MVSLKREEIHVHFNKHDQMHSSLKPPLSGNFPDVCKLDFLCCGGGGPRFFKKGPVVDLDAGQGPSQGRGGLSLMGAHLFWSRGELAAAACHGSRNMGYGGGVASPCTQASHPPSDVAVQSDFFFPGIFPFSETKTKALSLWHKLGF